MFIYIDESGSFVPALAANSWNVVAAFVAPEAVRKKAELALRQVKLAAGKAHDDEIKLRDISEEQLRGLSEFLCVRRFLNLSSIRSTRREGESVAVQYRELVHR